MLFSPEFIYSHFIQWYPLNENGLDHLCARKAIIIFLLELLEKSNKESLIELLAASSLPMDNIQYSKALMHSAGYTLVWIKEKTLVPSNFFRLLKLLFLALMDFRTQWNVCQMKGEDLGLHFLLVFWLDIHYALQILHPKSLFWSKL